jgi:hypothetical protein
MYYLQQQLDKLFGSDTYKYAFICTIQYINIHRGRISMQGELLSVGYYATLLP